VPEPQDMIVPLLREMRADIAVSRDDVRAGFATINARLDKLERRFDNLREAVNGESVLGRYTAAEVEERLDSIERRLAELETRR
jgi:tetrahydromethanopterin S-methyltransferase subunit G